MKEFDALNGMYLQFKQLLHDHSNKWLDSGLTEQSTVATVSKEVVKFRCDFFGKFLSDVKESFEKFKVQLTERLVQLMSQNDPYSTWTGDKLCVFPKNVRFWFRGQGSCVIVVEEPPQIRTLRFAVNRFKQDTFRLPLANTVFILIFNYIGRNNDQSEIWHLEKLKIAFTKKPLETTDDMLYAVPLPDLQGLDVCLGRKWNNPPGTLAQQTHEIVSYFWYSEFLDEWTANIDKFMAFPKKNWGEFFGAWACVPVERMVNLDFVPVISLRECIAQIALKYPQIFSVEAQLQEVGEAVGGASAAIKDSLVNSSNIFEEFFVQQLIASLRKVMSHSASATLNGLDYTMASKRQQELYELNHPMLMHFRKLAEQVSKEMGITVTIGG